MFLLAVRAGDCSKRTQCRRSPPLSGAAQVAKRRISVYASRRRGGDVGAPLRRNSGSEGTHMPPQATSDIGLIGLAVMGENLALNIADHGFNIAVYNRTTATMEQWVAKVKKEEPSGGRVVGCKTMDELVAAVKKPRKFIILVKAGPPVDAVVKELIAAGGGKDDIVVDCGNSLWTDTIRREREYASNCKFFGSGVSGGEVGARFGPSMMPGGDPDSWKHLKPIWEAVAAKVDAKSGKPLEDYAPGKPVTGGVPCTAYLGPNGA